ncbi:arsenate reductase/protein-tyrosine-phosphatase family protein [Phytohabitans rumicis]|uniref:Phosphotyrosine protein phosphatase I domain-containing protein n=1 Tax=Phytohabitans rumicis TaxID=1076125 RepID=A0A6V8LC56_9ACTN|nr:arsenate reductase ArsC [Phytohabitans rumicis]GFJ93220.1 hypothetical protein Prum_068620 [Phytohabitans rumicis]
MPRDLEQFELLNTRSQLRRAAEHAFAFYRGAISREECQQVIDDSYELLGKSARVKHHLVPLAQMWTIERLRRVGILDRRFTRTAPEVLFVDRHDTHAAPMAAALLASYARGRVHVSSAGDEPVSAIDPDVVRVLADLGVDAGEAFPKPLTDDAVRGADVIVLLADVAVVAGSEVTGQLLRWDVGALEGQPYEVLEAARDELDLRVLRLLADVLTTAGTV